jgi:hypothetical protein
MQKLIDRKTTIIHKNGQNVSEFLAPKKGLTLFGLFTFSRAGSLVKNTITALKEPVLKSSPLNVPRVNLTTVKNWVALEEKIVHDYKEQKTAQSKSIVSLPKTPTKQPLPGSSNLNDQGKKASVSLAAKKGFSLFGFIASPKIESRKSGADLPQKPSSKSSRLDIPRVDLTTVRNWVALEEKIVHDYKEKKTVQFKRVVPLSQAPTKQSRPVFETFSTQTAVSSPSISPALKDTLRGSGEVFSTLGRFLLVLGGLAVGVFILSHIQTTFSNRETLQKLVQLQNEKEQLGQSYATLKNVSEGQRAEMKWLNSQLHDMALQVKTAKADRIAYERNLEKKYREELMRITVRYESELAALRGTVQTQNAIVDALKAQVQAFEKVIDQAGMSALSGAAAGLSQEPFSMSETSVLQGKVTSVNEQQGFVVLNMGATQGVHSGRWITIIRSGIGLAVGRIDRVYPTMSVAVFRNAGILQVIQEGDSVSFS